MAAQRGATVGAPHCTRLRALGGRARLPAGREARTAFGAGLGDTARGFRRAQAFLPSCESRLRGPNVSSPLGPDCCAG